MPAPRCLGRPSPPPTCDQLGHIDGAFQSDALQFVFQDQLVIWVDILAPGRLGKQVVLERRGERQS